jgi:hypothetical protein
MRMARRVLWAGEAWQSIGDGPARSGRPISTLSSRPAGAQPRSVSSSSRSTAGCDLACDYCYMYEMADQRWREQPYRMSPEIVDRVAARIGEHVRTRDLSSVELVLHGGEPLLAGPDPTTAAVTTPPGGTIPARRAACSKAPACHQILTRRDAICHIGHTGRGQETRAALSLAAFCWASARRSLPSPAPRIWPIWSISIVRPPAPQLPSGISTITV